MLPQQLTDRAEGNALFAEEILSFLSERGALRVVAGKVEFDAGAVASALPASVQGLLTARVHRLAPRDRALLQAASVIGRRFDPQLLACVTDETVEVDARLAAMQALDLIPEISQTFEGVFGRAFGGLVRPYRTEDADTIVVALGSVLGTIKDTVDMLRAEGERVGALGITTFRPWPSEEVRRALRGANRIVVIEKDRGLVERELARRGATRKSGPHAENLLRDLGAVAAGPV